MKLLIVVGSVASDAELPPGVRAVVGAATEIVVVSPSIVGRLDWLTGDVDKARHLADERLEVVLGHLDSMGVSATGIRGDELPRTAFGEAVRELGGVDHILIGTAADMKPPKGMLDDLLLTLHLPVTLFEVQPATS